MKWVPKGLWQPTDGFLVEVKYPADRSNPSFLPPIELALQIDQGHTCRSSTGLPRASLSLRSIALYSQGQTCRYSGHKGAWDDSGMKVFKSKIVRHGRQNEQFTQWLKVIDAGFRVLAGIFCLGAANIFLQPAHSQPAWIEVDRTVDGTLYMIRIAKQGLGIAEAWIKEVQSDLETKQQFDCDTGTKRYLTTGPGWSDWTSIKSGSIDDSLLRAACTKQ